MAPNARTPRNERGAALIVAIGVLTFLITLSIIFFQMTRQELQVATNVSNRVRAELLVDGAFATAIAFLNHDLAKHPSYTSLDHAWQTYFNGAWLAGKNWAFPEGQAFLQPDGFPRQPRSETDRLLPHIDLAAMPPVSYTDFGGNTVVEPLFANATRDWLYVPRRNPNGPRDGDLAFLQRALDQFGQLPPELGFVLPPDLDDRSVALRTRADLINLWADVDNDEDGFNDSMWIPIGANVFFNDDGIDNDLDGFIDGDDPDGDAGIFFYRGDKDGVDNDGDGLVDEADEALIVFMTHPRMFVDQNGNAVSIFDPRLQQVLFNAGIGNAAIIAPDQIDNDYSLAVNDPIDASNFVHTEFSFSDPPNRIVYGMLNQFKFAGAIYAEPVTELVGRMAILIRDEASKVNIGVGGGQRFASAGDGTWGLAKSRNAGIGPHEFDFQMLPGIGAALAPRFWSFLMGDANVADTFPDFRFDEALPGYGRVDDDGNALWLAMDGIDNDGDGLIDEGLFLPEPGHPLFAAYASQLGVFEGIDEPQEYRSFIPFRNRIAETDQLNNNPLAASNKRGNQITDEIGELGDRIYRTTEQVKLLDGIAAGTFNNLRNVITVHSADKNERYRYGFTPDRPLEAPLFAHGRRATGFKLDYNLVPAAEIARALKEDRGYDAFRRFPFGQTLAAAHGQFALGLRSSGLSISAPNPARSILGGVTDDFMRSFLFGQASTRQVDALAADSELRAMQLAANIQDARDPDHARTELTTRVKDEWWELSTNSQQRDIEYTVAGLEAIRINEIMVRPVRRIEAEMFFSPADPFRVNNFNPNLFSAIVVGGVRQPDFISVRQTFNDLFGVNASQWPNPPRSSASFIGDRAFLLTTQSSAVFPGGTLPDIIEFTFRASPGLPPGRYYLTVNTVAINDSGEQVVTVTQPDQIEFAIKYVDTTTGMPAGVRQTTTGPITVGTQSILVDVRDRVLNNGPLILDTIWKTPCADCVTFDNMAGTPEQIPGRAPGWVFLDTETGPRSLIVQTQLPEMFGYQMGEAFVVELPTATDGSVIDLHVAVRKGPGSGPSDPLAINFFDFSQEPDHEWLELVNIDKQNSYDLSNWELEVGFGAGDPDRKVFRVPQNTRIAAGGMLLLGFNKYDEFQTMGPLFAEPTHSANHPIYANGIGLVRGTIGANTSYAAVTVPPIGHNFVADPALGSVFGNDFGVDFIDRDGDGVFRRGAAAEQTADDAVQSTVDTIWGATFQPRKPFDRIVELTDLSGDIRNLTGIDGVARLVLGGGIFPNYPEHDGIDNDGDGGEAGVLNNDGVNNDGDIFTDPFPTFDEGVDEGRYRMDRPPRWVVNPATNTASREPGETVPGSYRLSSETPVNGLLPPLSNPRRLKYEFESAIVLNNPAQTPYLFNITDAPAWTEFAERRFFPGDNIIVTLKDDQGRVVDRVTYTERDVINRAIDDVVPCPYTDFFDANGDGVPDSEVYLPTLNPLLTDNPVYGSYTWPDNTMAVDFYRSLERKHPLYHGDRFGTTNRWQATDGNYDDWAPSTSRWERRRDRNGNALLRADGFPALVNRVSAVPPDGSQDLAILYGHAVSGSPLRMNLSQRAIENPVRQPPITIAGQPARHFQDDNADPAVDDYRNRVRFAFERATVPNRSFTSPGELIGLALFQDRAVLGLGPVEPGGSINESIEPAPATPSTPDALFRSDVSVRQVLVGQDPENALDLAAVVSSGAMDPLVLTAAQAELVHPSPNAADLEWTEARAPYEWAPVFLFGPGDSPPAPIPFRVNVGEGPITLTITPRYLFNQAALLNSPHFLPGMADPLGYIESRWPAHDATGLFPSLPSRVAMYVSANDGVRPPAEAIFEWDRHDGLRNGVYDVYVVTIQSIAPMLNAAAILHPDSVPGGGRPDVFDREQGRKTGDYAVDLTVYGDRFAALSDGASFGRHEGAVPDEAGVIRYGPVRIENNYLALRLVNKAKPQRLNRFSRLILVPNNRTPGRININTVETRRVLATDERLFNGLLGVPGVMAGIGFNAAGNPVVNYPTAPSPPLRETFNTDFNNGTIQRSAGTRNQDILFRAANVAVRRTEHADGRYYEFISDIARPAGDPDLTILAGAFPGDLDERRKQFDEVRERFSRMANLVTVRSDVFEIIVTVQVGTGVDEDGDGRINWRSNTEFLVTSEQKARMVYER